MPQHARELLIDTFAHIPPRDAIDGLSPEDAERKLDGVPHSIAEIQQARAVVFGPFSFMRGRLPRYLSLEEHRDLGVYIAWYPAFTH